MENLLRIRYYLSFPYLKIEINLNDLQISTFFFSCVVNFLDWIIKFPSQICRFHLELILPIASQRGQIEFDVSLMFDV